MNIIKRDKDDVHCETPLGVHIDTCCTDAITLACKLRRRVIFDFNGIKIKVVQSSTSTDLVKFYQTEQARHQEAYLKSDEYKQVQVAQEANRLSLQKKVDELMLELKSLVITDDTAVKWVGDFADVNDHCGIKYDKGEIISILKEAGYRANAAVGNMDCKVIPYLAAAYIVGQAMDCLYKGMPIHPILAKFRDDYFNM